MTGAPEKYVGNGGMGVPCSKCAHSRWPAHKYKASSVNAVLLFTSCSERTACTVRIASSDSVAGRTGSPIQSAAGRGEAPGTGRTTAGGRPGIADAVRAGGGGGSVTGADAAMIGDGCASATPAARSCGGAKG